MAGARGVAGNVQRGVLGVGQTVQAQPVVRVSVEHDHPCLGEAVEQDGAPCGPFAVLGRALGGPLELDVTLLRSGDERLDGLRVVLESSDDGALLQRQEGVPGGCGPGQLAVTHGERALDVLAGGAKSPRDGRRRQAEQRKLIDGADLFDVGQSGTVLVLVPLPRDAVGLVVILGSGDEHRHQGLRGLDRGKRAAVAVAHADRSVLGPDGNDRLDHAVVLDGCHEVLVELGLADVQVDQQCGRAQHFERRVDGRHG